VRLCNVHFATRFCNALYYIGALLVAEAAAGYGASCRGGMSRCTAC
jgi:hypothetical protein